LIPQAVNGILSARYRHEAAFRYEYFSAYEAGADLWRSSGTVFSTAADLPSGKSVCV
jgi:hypothetical protein